MKVLLVGNFISHTGVHNMCDELAPRLQEHGWIVVTTSQHTGRAAKLLDILNTTWHERQRYNVAQIDVFSGLSFIWAEAVAWLLRRLHKPYSLVLRGGNLPRFAQRWSGRVRRLLNSAAITSAPSNYLVTAMQPYSQKEILLIPNPVDLSNFEYRLRSSAAPRLVWLRAFHEVYNPLLAVHVLRLLTAEFPDIQLVMVGPDKRDGTYQKTVQMIAAANLQDRLKVVGPVPHRDVPAYLNRGDILINTPNTDNTPVSLIEAMACGLCIVTTEVGGIPFLVDNEQNALMVPPDDPDAMGAAVRRILTEPELAERLSRNARKKAEQFDWSVILPQWETLLTRVAERIQ